MATATTLNYDPNLPVYPATGNQTNTSSSAGTTTASGLLAPKITNTPRTITENETVAGQVKGLLSSGSPLLKAAESNSLRASNQRGLMNSSIAAGEGTKAMIETAAPIAAQDASTYAASGLSAQNANQDLNKTSFDTQMSSYLKSQDLYNTKETQAQQGDINKTLQAQQGDINKTLQAQKDKATSDLQMALKQIDANLDIEKIASNDRSAFASSVAPIMQQYQTAYTNIQSQPDSVLSSTAKASAIADLTAMYRPQLESLSNIYGYEVQWESSSLPAATPVSQYTGTYKGYLPVPGQPGYFYVNGQVKSRQQIDTHQPFDVFE